MSEFNFSVHSQQWWDPDGPIRPLHDLTPLRGEFILNNCNSPKTAIDFGCGAGILTEWLTESGIKTKGIDISQTLIDTANRHAKLSNLEIEYICGNDFASVDKKVDLITCMEVLEHCEDYEYLMCMFADKLKKGGVLCVSTINDTWEAFFKIVICAEHILGIIPKGTHKKDYFIKPSALIRLAKKYGLQVLQIAGIEYKPYSRTGKLIKSLAGNYIIAFKNG